MPKGLIQAYLERSLTGLRAAVSANIINSDKRFGNMINKQT